MRHLLLLSSAAVILTACQTPAMIDPDPNVVSATYPQAHSIDAFNAADQDWRTVFLDARLQRLVELALDNSRPLRTAVLDAEAAQAQLRVQRAAFWPQLNAQGTYTRGEAGLTAEGPAPTASQASVGIGLTSFELDLFGRLRAQSDSAFNAYLAAEEGVNAAYIALSATVADAYVATLVATEQLALTEATLADWVVSESLTRSRFEAGVASDEELAQAEAQVRTAQAEAEGARRTLAVANNALTLAVGQPLPADLPPAGTLSSRPVLTVLPAGTPSDLLTRRPDIRQAERRLAGARADVRAARAAFFPSISLTGQFGQTSTDMDELFDGSARSWSFSPQISLPIFSAGRLQGQLDLAAIRSDSAVTAYELAIQTAFAEVADGLAGRATYGRQIAAQAEAVAATERRVRVADARYRAGVSSRLELLDAQRTLYQARQTLVTLRGAELSSSISLYRALGGGVRPSGPTG